MQVFWRYHVAILGTVAAILAAVLVKYIGDRYIQKLTSDHRERYRRRKFLTTAVAILWVLAVISLWGSQFPRTSTFFGLIGAGLAIALREPLLSVAGRIAIFAGHMFTVGDRIEINKMSGDVIDIGFFYTRMMEIGNWIKGDQVTGRLVQLSNAQIFGTPVFNYTQAFSYIWDEVTLPITYASNMEASIKALLEVGGDYTREFLQGAEQELREMQRYFLVPSLEVKPQVYVEVNSNWIGLTMRYVVDPKKRRTASSFIYSEVFKHIRQRNDITIASTTMDIAIHGQLQALAQPKQDKAA